MSPILDSWFHAISLRWRRSSLRIWLISRPSQGSTSSRLEAIRWGEQWYHRHYTIKPVISTSTASAVTWFCKQTHIHKLAMVLAASESDRLLITADHLSVADAMFTDLEPDMRFVFFKIRQSTDSMYAERLITFVHQHGKVSYTGHSIRGNALSPYEILKTLLLDASRAGYVKQVQEGNTLTLVAGVSFGDGDKRRSHYGENWLPSSERALPVIATQSGSTPTLPSLRGIFVHLQVATAGKPSRAGAMRAGCGDGTCRARCA